MENSILVVIPKGISAGILQSQMEHLARDIYHKHFQKVLMAVYKWDRSKLLRETEDIILYEDLSELKKLRDCVDYYYFRSVFDYCKLFPSLWQRRKMIYDFRGLSSFEGWYKNKSFFKFLLLYLLEGFAYLSASDINAVSLSLKKTLYKYYLIKRKINILPCLSSMVVERTDIANKPLRLAYIGGLSKWQCISDIIAWIEFIQKYFNVEFILITRDQDSAKQLLEKSKIDKFRILSGDYRFVQEQLMVMDFGFLIREDVLLNRVASPVKFLEYTSNGVIPIISKSVGDYSAIVKKNDLGVVLESDKELVAKQLNNIIKRMPYYREKLKSFSEKMQWKEYEEEEYLKLIND